MIRLEKLNDFRSVEQFVYFTSEASTDWTLKIYHKKEFQLRNISIETRDDIRK